MSMSNGICMEVWPKRRCVDIVILQAHLLQCAKQSNRTLTQCAKLSKRSTSCKRNQHPSPGPPSEVRMKIGEVLRKPLASPLTVQYAVITLPSFVCGFTCVQWFVNA